MTPALRIPHAPLSDAEWAALQSLLPRDPRGRPCDLRARFDAIFRLAATDGPWRELPAEHGRADTIARHFRRLTHQAVWERLLLGLSVAPAGHPLRRIAALICRAARRAIRLRGLRLVTLIRRLGLLRALPAPPWMCPDPDLSEKLVAQQLAWLPKIRHEPKEQAIAWLRAMRRRLTLAAGRRSIPRAARAGWP